MRCSRTGGPISCVCEQVRETHADDLVAIGASQAALHERAAATRRAHVGSTVFVRAVVELSNICRRNCSYCGMRREHRELERYRATVDVLAELLIHHCPSSVTDVNLQAGEDPVAAARIAVPLIRLIRRHTRLGVSVCLGMLDDALYAALRDAGADMYILKFETADDERYTQFEAPGCLAERLDHIRGLAAKGWFVSSGFIAGLPGDDGEALLANCRLAEDLPLHGCSVSPFVPGESTPFASLAAGDADHSLNCMAALRLRRPHWVIPAVSALDLAQAEGYRRGLAAGANLVTINLTPEAWQRDYILYRRNRRIMTEERVLAALDAEGLQPSRVGLIEHWRGGVSRPDGAG